MSIARAKLAHRQVEVIEVADWVPVGPSVLPAAVMKVADWLLIALPAVFTARFTDDPDGGPELQLTFAVRSRTPECVEVLVTPAGEGQEVRTSHLTGIRVEDLMERAIVELRVVRGHGDRDPVTGMYDFYDPRPGEAEIAATRAARAARKVKITDELLREVAAIYRANVDHKPLEAVAARFDRAHRTAALYVARARERGFLSPALKGKAGERHEENQ